MGSQVIEDHAVQHVDWSRYSTDITVEGSRAVGLQFSEVDLRIMLNLMNRTTPTGEGVVDGSVNLQNLRSVFRSMLQHLERRRG